MESMTAERTGTVALPVEGMHCASCARTVETAVGSVSGVRKVTVSLGAEKAFVEYDPQAVTPRHMADAVASVGYRVPIESAAFRVEGLQPARAGEVSKAVTALEGVANVSVATGAITVQFYPGTVSLAEIKRTLRGRAGDERSQKTRV